ncbi:MAG TPA: ABC transporter substrate-binding protein [Ottowia sp.]|nr:ABC transporter substrate-binding protein [Ottowia sp.]
MKRTRAACLLTCAWLIAASAGFAQTNENALAAQREAGRALFHGERMFQRPVKVAGAAMPSDAAACALCHGRSGQGGLEAGVSVPWLSEGTPPSQDLARRVVQALARGQSVRGQALQPPMPRYDLTPAERDALAAFLAVLGTDAEPVRGVDARQLRIGMVLPRSGPRANAAQAAFRGLQGQFEQINRSGGLYGRQLRLVALPMDADPTGPSGPWQQQLAAALAREPVLALAGSWIGDLPAPQWQWLQKQRLPLIANLGPALREPAATPGWTTSLLPSVQAQLAGSATDFDTRCVHSQRLQVALAPVSGLREAVAAALPGRTLGFNAALPASAAAATAPAGTAADTGQHVLALLPAAEVEALRQRLGPQDCLWTLAMFSGAGGAKARGPELLVLPAQATLPLAGGDPQALWESLGRLAGQLTAELLSQAGRRVQPESLVRAQLTQTAFEPAPGVKLELTRTRRHALPVLATWRKNDDNP